MTRKFLTINIEFQGKRYFFNRYLGLLFSQIDKKEKSKIDSNKKIPEPIKFVKYPYQCRNGKDNPITPKENIYIRLWGVLLTYFLKNSFVLGQIFSRLCFRYFNNTIDAVSFYRKYIHPENQNDLCLSRCLFAAATSKSFKRNGFIFIGVFLPSNSLHAWIIEDGFLVDRYDDSWILYQPVALIYYE